MTDWSQWSREAVELLSARERAWSKQLGLEGAAFLWDIDKATCTFSSRDGRGEVSTPIRLVGTTSSCEGTFLWSWANEAMPAGCVAGMERVRAFGEEHDLPLLTTPEWTGGRPDGLEMLAVAGRILDAESFLVDTVNDLTLFFLIFDSAWTPATGGASSEERLFDPPVLS